MMKIVFICGSLELGRDGVGDYTIRLAESLVQAGNQVGIVAVNDSYIKNEIAATINQSISTLRIPAAYENTLRFEKLTQYLNLFAPDWVSLQYVPFSFHPKGLPFAFNRHFAKIFKRFKVHIMFHELWLGIQTEASVKLKLWGLLQKHLIKNLIQDTSALVIHTHTPLYKDQLHRIKTNARLLPLFGNINLNEQLFTDTKTKYDKLIVLFGSIHPVQNLDELVAELKQVNAELGKKLKIIFVGRNGAEQKRWVGLLAVNGISYEIYNEQPPEKISEILYSADIGISTTPFLLAQKSGTIASMIEHGLKVICISNKWSIGNEADNYSSAEPIYRYQRGILSDLLSANESERKLILNKTSSIAKLFASDLEAVEL